MYYIFGITLVMLLGFSSIVPCLPRLTRHFQVSPDQAAAILTFATLPGIVLTPVMGMLSDRVGRKAVIVPALLVYGCASIGCAFAPSFPVFLGMRFLQGVGIAPLVALNYTVIGDIYSDSHRRTVAMSFNSGVFSLGMTVFPVIGGWLSELHWNLPFFLVVTAFPLAFFIARGMPQSAARADQAQPLKTYLTHTLRIVFQRQALTLLCLSLSTLVLLYGVLYTHFPLLADQRFHALPSAIGTTFSMSAFGIITATLSMSWLLRHFRPARLMEIAFLCFGLVMLAIPLASSMRWTWAIFYLWGLGQGLLFPNVNGTLAGLAPAEYRGGLMAVNGFAFAIAQSAGPLIFGAVHAFTSIRTVFWTGAAFACCMLLVTAWALRPAASPERAVASPANAPSSGSAS